MEVLSKIYWGVQIEGQFQALHRRLFLLIIVCSTALTMDSLRTVNDSIVTLRSDSLAIAVNRLTEQVSALDNKLSASPWFPILAAGITGLILILGQWLQQRYEQQKNLKETTVSLYTECLIKIYEIRNLLTELATFKNLQSYWHFYFLKARNDVSKKYDEMNVTEYNERVLKNHEDGIQCRRELGELLANLLGKLQMLKLKLNSSTNLIPVIELITAIDWDDAKELNGNLTDDEVSAEYEINRKQLHNSFITKLIPISKALENLKKDLHK